MVAPVAKVARFKALAERLIDGNATIAALRTVTATGPEYAPVHTPTYQTINVFPAKKTLEDLNNDTLAASEMSKYLVSTSTGVVPHKSARMAIGVDADTATESSDWLEIEEVEPLDYGADTLMYTVFLRR